eukprot:Pgem_evm1s18394
MLCATTIAFSATHFFSSEGGNDLQSWPNKAGFVSSILVLEGTTFKICLESLTNATLLLGVSLLAACTSTFAPAVRLLSGTILVSGPGR